MTHGDVGRLPCALCARRNMMRGMAKRVISIGNRSEASRWGAWARSALQHGLADALQ